MSFCREKLQELSINTYAQRCKAHAQNSCMHCPHPQTVQNGENNTGLETERIWN